VQPTNKELITCAIILTPAFIFLLVWFALCVKVLFDDTMIEMDKGIVAVFMVLGIFGIKKISLSLMKVKDMLAHNKANLSP